MALKSSDKTIIMCLRLLLNSEDVNRVLETYLEQIVKATESRYGLFGERKTDPDNGEVYYKYYGIYGLNKDSQPYKHFKEKGYLEDREHSMHIDLIDGTPVYYNDLLRKRNKPYPKGHPVINKVIFIPLKNTKGYVIGVLGLGGDNNFTDEFTGKYKYWIDLSSLFLQVTLERFGLIKSKDSFLANISHELRTPLSGITCMINILSESKDLSNKDRQYIKIIDTCCTQLLELTNDILDYTSMSNGKFILKNEPVVFKKLVEQLKTLLNDRITDGIKLSILLDPHIPDTVAGDNTRIIQVLMNVIGNSIKFANKSGIVNVMITYQGFVDKKHKINFIIKDTGCGIAKDKLEHVFDMINHFDPNYLSSQCGVGLGLPITRYIVDKYNGEINIDSTYGVGTTVNITMLFDQVTELAEIGDYFNDRNVLILISDEYIRDLVFDVMSDLGARVITAFDSGNFNRYLQTGDRYEFRVIITDTEILTPSKVPIVMVNQLTSASELKEKLLVNIKKDIMPTQSKDNQLISDPIDSNNQLREKAKILIAEDNLQNQEVLKLLLTNMGYHNIKIIADGLDLYNELVGNNNYDLVFVDLKMPIMDGISAIRKFNEIIKVDSRLQAKRSNMIILATTASVSPDTRKQCYDSGMDGYLSKPIKITDLQSIDPMLIAINTQFS